MLYQLRYIPAIICNVTHQYTKGELITMAKHSYDGTVVAEAIRHKVTHQKKMKKGKIYSPIHKTTDSEEYQ